MGCIGLCVRCSYCTETEDNTDSHWVLCSCYRSQSRPLSVWWHHKSSAISFWLDGCKGVWPRDKCFGPILHQAKSSHFGGWSWEKNFGLMACSHWPWPRPIILDSIVMCRKWLTSQWPRLRQWQWPMTLGTVPNFLAKSPTDFCQ